jgi:hypothetical protein
LIDPEDDGCSDADGGHEGVRAAVIASVDTPPVFEPAEHDLDFVALAVENCVVGDVDFWLILKECRLQFCGRQVHRGTSLHHILCHLEVLWPSEKRRSSADQACPPLLEARKYLVENAHPAPADKPIVDRSALA